MWLVMAGLPAWGQVHLRADQPISGEPLTLTVNGAAPGSDVVFLWSSDGTGNGPCPPPLGGMCLDIRNPTRIATEAANASGTASTVWDVPVLVVGSFVSVQAVVIDAPFAKTWVLSARVGTNGPIPQTFDLATDASATLTGSEASSQTGLSLVVLDDMAGDGAEDLAVGAFFLDAGQPNGGGVYVLGGPLSGAMDIATAASSILLGDSSDGQAGVALAGGGDMDGDGVTDIAIGAPQHPNAAGFQRGAVHIVPANAASASLIGFAEVLGSADNERLGQDVAILGDADGDGLDDLFVGIPGENAAVNGRGAAYFIPGPIVGSVLGVDVATGAFVGGKALEGLGGAVAAPGDIDGDGLADMLAGSSANDDSGIDAGGAYVILSPLAGVADTSSGFDARWLGEVASDAAGTSVEGAGDFDGDGTPDLLVGALANDSGGNEAGAVYVASGALTGTHSLADALLILQGDTAGMNLGGALANAGDIDGDGLDDALMGAPRAPAGGIERGAAYLVYGGLTGIVDIDVAAGVTMLGAADFDQEGWGLGAGDVDGDGLRDLIVGGPNADAGDGGAFVISGADL